MIEAAPCPFCGGEGIKRYIDAALKNEALDKKEIRQLKAEVERLQELVADLRPDGEFMPDEQRKHLRRLLEEALEVCILSGGGYLNEYPQ